MSDLPAILALAESGDHRYVAGRPEQLPEGRDVVFSGQLLGQMILASDREAGGSKDVRSAHTVFARAGSYSKPIDLDVDSMHAGRTWASDTVTASQEGKLLARGLVLLNTVDADLMRHGPEMPAGVADAADLDAGAGQVFPGAEWRPVPGEPSRNGVPVAMAWHRYQQPLPSTAANQAVLAWATCGDIIGLAMRPHRDRFSIAEAHRSLSTGVIAHTIHFVEPIDVSRWLLVVVEGTSASNGRVYGTGSVFRDDGALVAVFHQDSMAKALEASADPRRAL
jgi:acyl-CoA thioesterase II